MEEIIVGLYNSNTAGVALIENLKLIYAASEERFTRIKQQSGFPTRSLKYALETFQIDPAEINHVAYGGYNPPSREAVADYLKIVRNQPEKEFPKYVDRLHNSLSTDFLHQRDFYLKVRASFPNAAIHSIDHHKSHAYAALAFSNLNANFILVADGRGDLQSLTIWREDQGILKRILTNSELRSMGFFYGQITKYLGFKPYRHEGKVTGLAAYGEHSSLVDKLSTLIHFDYKTLNIEVTDNFEPYNSPNKMAKLQEILRPYSREQIAYAAQFHLEIIITQMIKAHIPEDSHVSAAGGIFANVKLNQKIQEECKLRSFIVFPEMSDGGLCVGAAYAAKLDRNKEPTTTPSADVQRAETAVTLTTNLTESRTLGEKNIGAKHHIHRSELIISMYLGSTPGWENYEFSKNNDIRTQKFTNKIDQANFISKEISSGKIVGIAIGKAEFGPRALGGRSILFDPRGPFTLDDLNKRFSRTDFMPFAPVILEEYADKYLENFKHNDMNTRYMTTCYNCTEIMKKSAPLVVHVDGTCRPQIVKVNHELELYRRILEGFQAHTGIGCLANTSFNRHEEPIINSAHDAVNALKGGLIDLLVAENNLILFKK